MTALDAYETPVARDEQAQANRAAGPGKVVPMTSHASPVAQSSGTGTTPLYLTGADGTRLVGGLTWEIATGPETPVLQANAPRVLRLPGHRAQLSGPEGDRCGSLLLALAAGLTRIEPDADGPRVFMAEIPGPDGTPLIWLGLADLDAPGRDNETPARVTPRPGPEEIFTTSDQALTALQKHLSTTDVTGIAVRWLHADGSQCGHILQGLTHIAPTLPLHDVEPETADLPLFTAPRRVPVKLLGGVGAGTALLLTAILLVAPMVRSLFETPPPAPPEMVPVAIEDGAFASACTGVLEGWWPRSVGWTLRSAGCALPGHLPENLRLSGPEETGRLVTPLIIWHHLVPGNARNSVLARAAADQMVDNWPHEARLDASGLILWQVAALPLVPVTSPDGQSSVPDQTRTRLAALWAETPDAVTAGPGGHFTIAGADNPGTMFTRAAQVPGLTPVRFTRQNTTGSAELVLAPRTPRRVPATLFGSDNKGGPAE